MTPSRDKTNNDRVCYSKLLFPKKQSYCSFLMLLCQVPTVTKLHFPIFKVMNSSCLSNGTECWRRLHVPVIVVNLASIMPHLSNKVIKFIIVSCKSSWKLLNLLSSLMSKILPENPKMSSEAAAAVCWSVKAFRHFYYGTKYLWPFLMRWLRTEPLFSASDTFELQLIKSKGGLFILKNTTFNSEN